jgi:hypothetical protein
LKAIALGLLITKNATGAFAMCPYPTPRACSAYFESDAVFVATVVSEQRVDDYLRFGVRVSRVLRGKVDRSAVVYSGDDTARLLWDVGREYVVFAKLVNGRLESGDDCGPLSDPARVAKTINEIEGLRHVTDAVVEGEVLATQPEGAGVAGVGVDVVGSGRTYRVRSDARGRFRVRVPAGRYEANVDPRVAKQSDYNLGTDPRRLVLVPGQCAQLQFVTR